MSMVLCQSMAAAIRLLVVLVLVMISELLNRSIVLLTENQNNSFLIFDNFDEVFLKLKISSQSKKKKYRSFFEKLLTKQMN